MKKNICVYCGSSMGKSEAYASAARMLGQEIVKRGYRLVYGGASVGLMSVLADAVLEAGGEVVGVMPESLLRKEIAHQGLTELEITATMSERKVRMAELADAFIALPGGAGTLEELFEVWTWGQLQFHNKPCGLLNVSGYFDRLVEFLRHTVAEGFIRKAHLDMVMVDEDSGRLLDRFDAYQAPAVEKWQ